jgi:hypothetical protein
MNIAFQRARENEYCVSTSSGIWILRFNEIWRMNIEFQRDLENEYCVSTRSGE